MVTMMGCRYASDGSGGQEGGMAGQGGMVPSIQSDPHQSAFRPAGLQHQHHQVILACDWSEYWDTEL